MQRNVVVGILSSLLSSFYLAAVAKLVASAFGRGAVISFWDLVTISVIGGVLASAIALLVTVGMAVLSFRKGWDLDAVSTPMVTAIGDMVTLPCLFLASLLVGNDTLNAITAGFCTVAPAPRWSPRSAWSCPYGGSCSRCSRSSRSRRCWTSSRGPCCRRTAGSCRRCPPS